MKSFRFVPALMIAVAACQGQPSLQEVNHFGKVEATTYPASSPDRPFTPLNASTPRICRFLLDQLPPTLGLFDYTSIIGGRTCYLGGRTVLFLPASDGSCAQPPAFNADHGENLPLGEAEDQYISCSPLNARTAEPQPSVIFQPSANATEEDEGFFLQFGFDVGALITNDGLPVSHYILEEYRICMETDRAAEVVSRVRDADIVNFDFVSTEFSTEPCELA